MPIPSGVIILWTGTHAGIPSGWVRETSLDSKFLKGAPNATNPNVSGGNANHTHTSPSHSHVMLQHTHTVGTDGVSGGNQNSDVNGSEVPDEGHSHTGVPVSNHNGGDLQANTLTYGAFSNEPPYKDIIFIRSNGSNQVPANGVVLWADNNSANNPSGFSIESILADLFAKGAGTGANAGGTGGSYNNNHGISHSHTANSHYHDQFITGYTNNPNGSCGRAQGGGNNYIACNHSHTYTLDSQTPTVSGQNPSTLNNVETVQPLFKKLLAMKNTGSPNTPKNIIGIWLGSLASIPAGWKICDGANGTPDMRDYFLKIATNHSEIGNTGGSNTHTHSSLTHSHTGSSHSHNQNGGNFSHVKQFNGVGGGKTLATGDGGNQHDITSVSSVTANWDTASTTADSSNNEPPYLTVAFIMLKTTFGGAAQKTSNVR